MKKFKSTETLMAMLESGDYKRPLMQNDKTAFNPEETFESVFQNFKARTSRPNNYDYFTRRCDVSGGDGE